MRIEICILSPTEAEIYFDLGNAYKVNSSAGYYWKLFDPDMNEVRRWRYKENQTIKDAIPEALRLLFLHLQAKGE